MISTQKVLVVEDEPVSQAIIVELLKDAGIAADFAENGQEALGILKAQPESYNSIVSDWIMPVMSGLDLLNAVKSDPELTHIPFSLLTAKTQKEDMIEGTKQGVFQYILKPFDHDVLVAKVQASIAEYERFHKVTSDAEEAVKSIRQYAAGIMKKQGTELNEMASLAETGEQAATIVHDAKNVTGAIGMDLDMFILPALKEILPENEQAHEILEVLLEHKLNMELCTESLNSLLALSRSDKNLEPTDISKLVSNALSLLKAKLHGITLNFQPLPGAAVMGNTELIRVFTNLVGNAADELNKAGIVDPKIRVHIKNEPDETISIMVRDNGKGIPPEVLTKIQKGIRISTKGAKGNGFGLLGVRKIIALCGGEMQVQSSVDQGAAFIVKLQKPV